MPRVSIHCRSAALALLIISAGAVAAQTRIWDSANSTRTFTAIPLASDDTVNPMRGYTRWQNQELVPQAAPALDSFRRYHWRDLEAVQGQYTFGAIIADMKAARDEGRKYAFRLRMMAGYDDDQVYAPAYLVNNLACLHGCGFWADSDPADPGLTWVPDWNDPFVIARSRALLQALAQRIGAEGLSGHIAWIDVGLYGQYGEWAIRGSVYNNRPAGIEEISPTVKREYAKMHFEAFPSQQHVMFIPASNIDALDYGLNHQTITTKPVGLRVDCLAKADYFSQWTARPDDWALIEHQWKKAPFVSEFCPFSTNQAPNGPAAARAQVAKYHISSVANANFALAWADDKRWDSLTPSEKADMLMLGREAGYRYGVDKSSVLMNSEGQFTFTATFRNSGNAPTYEPWKVNVELVNSAGVVTWAAPLPVQLGELAGGGVTQSVQGSWLLPTMASGVYTVRLIARDARGNVRGARKPLQWVVSERSPDGGISVRTVRRR